MKNYSLLFLFFCLTLLFSNCKTYEAKPYNFPRPVDTTTKPIQLQEKKTYKISSQGVYADNQFDAARLNNFEHVEGNRFLASIDPENTPINMSPYYAFKLWSDTPKTVEIELNYKEGRHRYKPKLSSDGKDWTLLPDSLFRWAPDSLNGILTLELSPDALWVAGQEIQSSTIVREWGDEKAKHSDVRIANIGKSKLGRDLWALDIHNGSYEKEDIISIISRQHPPEVTGYLAMKAFIDAILEDNKLANAFRKKYRLLVVPLMNPDGVDLGHWRHNAGGVDLNRDWAYYNQPENHQVADFHVREAKKAKSDIILGLDFHSTWYDVYYTHTEIPKHLAGFQDYWLQGIHESLHEDINEKPSGISTPISKNWYRTQFGATGITYEIGDNTPRDYIKEKGRISAIEMMELLILRNTK